MVVENSLRVYNPSEYVTIDEKLEAFRGRCTVLRTRNLAGQRLKKLN